METSKKRCSLIHFVYERTLCSIFRLNYFIRLLIFIECIFQENQCVFATYGKRVRRVSYNP